MIKLAIGPLHGVVALFASGGKASMRYGCCCIVEVGLMAADAGRIGDVVVIVDVAVAALTRRNGVIPSQGEP